MTQPDTQKLFPMSTESTYREDLTDALAANGETWPDVESHTLTEAQLDESFCHGFGGVNGAPFTLWTARHVYFPACYDGSEWIASGPRHPNGRATEHVGV